MRLLLRLGRVLSLILLAVVGTSVLMYAAPGYFTDAREMDSMHASAARSAVDQLKRDEGTVTSLLAGELHSWMHGDLGHSRQFDVPVSTLLRERGLRSMRLLALGILAGWSGALLFAIPLSFGRSSALDFSSTVIIAVLLAVPAGVLATACVVANKGGPVLVLGVVIAARDLKLFRRILQDVWQAPFVLHAHSYGMTTRRIFRLHVLSAVRGELLSVLLMSFALALSALVPVEVIFDLPGLGQLAWSAAMNRDLPVLVAVTGIMSACIGIAVSMTAPEPELEQARCA